MTFLSTLALAVAVLVVAPYLAHRLRRRRAEEQPFPPARLVLPAPPRARRRSRIEDVALLVTRAAAIVALAVLGATPFVRCSRLSLQRSGGASIAMAIVVDDSMSMRANARGRSRFERAREGALELLASAREGDAAAIVLGGAPARVALAATTDLAAARRAIEALSPSDRATDLDGAVVLAQGLVGSLPQIDRRVIVLSDLADGQPDAPPLGEGATAPLWVALPELRVDRPDCAVLRADRRGLRVHVALACGPGKSPAGREVIVENAQGEALGRAPAPQAGNAEVTILLPTPDASPARARLTGLDAVTEDDSAPVLPEAARSSIALVVDAAEEAVVTGGAPIVEQAFGALKLEVDARPIPAVPDRVEDLASELGLLVDDPPGLTPEQRHALGAFVDGGGVVLLALGPHAAAAPLGATLEPVLTRPVGWTENGSAGADAATALGSLAESAASLADLAAPRRAVLAPEDVRAFEPLVTWTDGAPLLLRRVMGRGEVWVVTLPFSVDVSDLTLRPGFLALLRSWVIAARARTAPQRSTVGAIWTFPGARSIQIDGPAGPLPVSRSDGVARLVAPLIGAYRISADGKTEVRVASPDPRELDLRPRATVASAAGGGLGERRASVDVSGPVAIGLLGLVALEMALRVWSRRRLEASDAAGA